MDVWGCPLVPGLKRVEVASERLSLTIPLGLHSELVRLLQVDKQWVDRQEFIRHAIREQLARRKEER